MPERCEENRLQALDSVSIFVVHAFLVLSPTQPPAAPQYSPNSSRHQSVTIDGIPVFAGSARDAMARCLALTRQRQGARIATANLDFLALARQHPQLKHDLTNSTLVVADGMPVVWLGKLAGGRSMERLAGVDLVRELFVSRADEPLRVAVYGSTEETSLRAVESLHSVGNGARVVVVANPPFRALSSEEKTVDLERLKLAKPDVVLVALGCPAQERLIASWAPVMPSVTWIGIGGALDFYAGVRRRAPRALQRGGLEWVVRMVQEPRRLGPRYFLRDLPALAAIAPGCVRTRFTTTKQLARS